MLLEEINALVWRWSIKTVDQAAKEAFADFIDHDASVRPAVRGLLVDLEIGCFSESVLYDCGLISAAHHDAWLAALKRYLFQVPSLQETLPPLKLIEQRLRRLDQIYGDSKQMTAFVRKYAPAYGDLQFESIAHERGEAEDAW